MIKKNLFFQNNFYVVELQLANVHEALSSESKRDFIHKLSIALKESKETSYWLNLLKDSNYIASGQYDKLNGRM